MKLGCIQLRKISLILLPAAALTAGCTKSESYEQQPNLRAIAAYYSQYLAHNRGQIPADEKAFTTFIQDKGGAALSHKGLTVDDLFISTRDGKPFVVKYRGEKSWPLPDAIAYEQEGRDGTRHIATVVGEYDVISEEEFRQKADRSAKKR